MTGKFALWPRRRGRIPNRHPGLPGDARAWPENLATGMRFAAVLLAQDKMTEAHALSERLLSIERLA